MHPHGMMLWDCKSLFNTGIILYNASHMGSFAMAAVLNTSARIQSAKCIGLKCVTHWRQAAHKVTHQHLALFVGEALSFGN